MGLFDDMSSLVGKSLDIADKKAQRLKLQTQLSHIEDKKVEALSELGRIVLVDMGSDPRFLSAYSSQIGVISDLEHQEVYLNEKIESLNNAPAALVDSARLEEVISSTSTVSCPQCGARVNLADSFCSSCGKDVASIKTEIKKCEACGRAYATEVAFCESCGSPTQPFETVAEEEISLGRVGEKTDIELGSPVSSSSVGRGDAQAEEAAALPRAQDSGPKKEELSGDGEFKVEELKCPLCGQPAVPDALFCGFCGASLSSANDNEKGSSCSVEAVGPR